MCVLTWKRRCVTWRPSTSDDRFRIGLRREMIAGARYSFVGTSDDGGTRLVSTGDSAFAATGVPSWTGAFELLVIGASFGGPKAIETLLGAIPKDFPVPIAICQHIATGFTQQWAWRLGTCCQVEVVEAENRMRMKPGVVYLAPAGGRHMRFIRATDGVPQIRLDADFADSLHVPSIDMMMSSAAHTFGSRVLAVLLTGLGSDGAIGMLHVRQAGGYTLAESEETAASYSMPGSAVGLGAVAEELPLGRLQQRMVELGSRR